MGNDVTVTDSGSFKRVTYNRLNTGYAAGAGNGSYGGVQYNDNQSFFDYNLREYLFENGFIGEGGAGSDFIDIDQYDPNIYSYDMFHTAPLMILPPHHTLYTSKSHVHLIVRIVSDPINQ